MDAENVNLIVNAQLPETILTLTTSSDGLPNSQLVLSDFVANQQNKPSSLTVISAPQAESEAKSTLPWVFSVSSGTSPTPEKTRKRGPGRPRKSRLKAPQQAKEIEEDKDVEGRTTASRTRSGRLSKPPIHNESLHNGSPKHPALAIGSDYETCHSKQVSDEGPGEFEAPDANYTINKNTSFAGRTWKRGRKRAGPYWLHTPAVRQEKKNHRLAEAVNQLDDDEFLSLFGSRVAASMTTWDFLLMKARAKNPFSILPTLLTEVKNLAHSMSSLAKESLVPRMLLEQDKSSKFYQLTDSAISGLIGLPCGTYEIVSNSSLIEHASSTCQRSLEHASPSRNLPCGRHTEMWATMEDATNDIKNHLEASDLKIRNMFSRSVNVKDQNLAQANDNGIAGLHHDESASLSGLGVTDLMQVDDMVNQAACSTDSLLLTLRPDLPSNKKLVTQFDLASMEAFAIPAHGEDSSSSLSKDFFTEALRKSFPNC